MIVVTTFTNGFVTVVFGRPNITVQDPVTGERIVDQRHFFRLLHEQRRVHRRLGDRYRITQHFLEEQPHAEQPSDHPDWAGPPQPEQRPAMEGDGKGAA
jgi:hypothetical protein